MDSNSLAQIILTTVIAILTITLVVLGIQIFLILKESKETLKKVNKILDGASGVIGSAGLISNPLIKVLLGAAVAFLSKKEKVKEIREFKEKKQSSRKEKPRRRFFFRTR